MIQWGLALLFVPVLYLSWKTLLSTWRKLSSLGVEHRLVSTWLFDSILKAFFLAGVISRFSWMILNLDQYAGLLWSFAPFEVMSSSVIWFRYLPWRYLLFLEGMELTVLWLTTGVLTFIVIFLPTVRLVRTLKLEKRGIVRNLLIQSLLGAFYLLAYFILLGSYSYFISK